MIIGTLCVIFLIAMICAGNNGEWGSVLIGAIIVLLLIGIGDGARSTSRAYRNFIDHWEKKE